MTSHYSPTAHRLLMRELEIKASILRISVAVAAGFSVVVLLWGWAH
jgi:hypothetical protein